MRDAGAPRPRVAWLLAATPIMLLLTHYAAVLPHEFAHSFMAWLVGIKPNPLLIDWGGTSLLNVLLLIHIDENVDYSAALEAGKRWQVALVAFAGPGLTNGGLYLLSRRLIQSPAVDRRPWGAYVLFWFLFINLANLYCYVPLRRFAADGDVEHFRLATGLSPWAIYVVGGYLVLWGLIDCYRFVLPWMLDTCGFVSRPSRATLLVVATALMFGYYAVPGLEEPDPISLFMARSSVLAIPVVILLWWRRTVTAGSWLPLSPRNLAPPALAPRR